MVASSSSRRSSRKQSSLFRFSSSRFSIPFAYAHVEARWGRFLHLVSRQSQLDTNEGEFAAHVPIDFRSQKARVRAFPPRVADCLELTTPIPSSTFSIGIWKKKEKRYRYPFV